VIENTSITAQGAKTGGYTGHNGMLPMVPVVVDVVVDIPVAAASGIADG
jgi:NAD(P)H-dependent flavin oxidoreductase YrpB (nitropropane dioxygenase family)